MTTLAGGYSLPNTGPSEARIPGVTLATFRDSTTPTTPDGTPVSAQVLNDVVAEIVSVIAAAGLTPAAGALQLLDALSALLSDGYERLDNSNIPDGRAQLAYSLELLSSGSARKVVLNYDHSAAGTNGTGSNGRFTIGREDELGVYLGDDIEVTSQGDLYFQRGFPRWGAGGTRKDGVYPTFAAAIAQGFCGNFVIFDNFSSIPDAPYNAVVASAWWCSIQHEAGAYSYVVKATPILASSNPTYEARTWTKQGTNTPAFFETPWRGDSTVILASGTANGYPFRAVQHSDGTIIQTGVTQNSVTNAEATATLPVAFSNSLYSVVAVSRNTSNFGASRANHGARPVNAQQFNFWQESVVSPFNYIAIGT